MKHRHAKSEALELRRLFAVTWDGGGDGINWMDGLNWSTNNVPTLNVDAVINVPGSNPVIRIGNGAPTFRSLTTSEDIFLQGQISIGYSITLQGGATIRIGDAANPGTSSYWIRFNKSPTSSIDGTGNIELGSKSAGIFVDNFFIDEPTMTIGAGVTIKQTGGTEGYVRLASLAGGGSIINHGTIEAAAPNATLEVGGFAHSSSLAERFDSDGTLAVSNGGYMDVAGTWASTGPMNVSNGTFALQGSYTPASIANVHRTGPGATTLSGEVRLGGQPFVITDEIGSLTLNGYLFGPGPVQTPGSTATLICNGGALIDLTIDGRMEVRATMRTRGTFSAGSQAVLTRTTGSLMPDGGWSLDVQVADGAHFSNQSISGSVTIPAHATLYTDTFFSASTTKLTGDGSTITAVGSQSWGGEFMFQAPNVTDVGRIVLAETSAHTPMTLTLLNGCIVRGGRGMIVDDAGNAAPATLSNNGIVHASITGTALTVAPGIFTNLRTIQVSSGATLDITTVPTNYNPATHALTGGGWVVAAGCTLRLPAGVTIFDNAATVSLSGAGSLFAALDSITRNSGTILLASGRSFSPTAGLRNDGIINVNAGGTMALVGTNGIDGGGSIAVASGGSLATAHVRQNSLSDQGLVTITPSGDPSHVSVLNTLSITGSGKFDLADNDLHMMATPAWAIGAYIANAYHFGDWLGMSGLFSSTARDNPIGNTTLGLLSGAEYLNNNGAQTFDGQTVQTTDVLVKYTYFGDVDFNGQVDVGDYNVVDFGFANGLTGWAFGDADYSGGVDVSDYNLIDFAFASQFDVL